MQKLSNEKALSFVDSFLTQVREEKQGEESPIDATSQDTGGEPAGTVPASVEGEMDNSPENTKEEKKQENGEFNREKSQDLQAAVTTTDVEDADAENNDSKDDERAAVGDIGAEAIEGAEEEKPSYIEAEKMKVAEEQTMLNEMKRAQELGNKILEKYAARQEKSEEGQEKTAEEQELETLIKQAADEAYHEFVTSYQAGLLKRAEDEAAVQEALGVSPEEASAMLDEVAMESPEAVLPAEEAMPEEAAGDEVTEDELLDALVEMGVTPEELEEAAGEVAAEDAAMEVEASDRKDVLKDLVRTLKQ